MISDEDLFYIIRYGTLFGIPLDIVAHFFLGAVIGWVTFMVFGCSYVAYYILFALCLVKEFIIDYQAILYSQKFAEPIKDIIVSMIGGVLLLVVASSFFRVPKSRRRRHHH